MKIFSSKFDKSYLKAMEIMNSEMSKDCVFSLATAVNNIPSVRFVDTYYDGENFYIVTHADTGKVKDIESNPNAALCSSKMNSFKGVAFNIGHPLKADNSVIREKLIKSFEKWYFKHNDENDKKMCYIKFIPYTGFIHSGGKGYKIDFVKKSATEIPFACDIVMPAE